MDQVVEQEAYFIPNLPGVVSRPNPEALRCASTDNDDRWVAKTTEWPYPGCQDHPLRVGVEYAYYALAQHNGLNMTEARVLKIGDQKCWATKYLPNRTALVEGDADLTEEGREMVRQGLVNSPAERVLFLRLVFLDLFLLGADRKPSNLLKQMEGNRLRLFPIDHGQSLGWRNNIESLEANRIRDAAEEYARMEAYTQLEATYHWGRIVSDPNERQVAFNSIKLDGALLDQLRPWIPPAWFPTEEFQNRRAALVKWWNFLRDLPYPELDAKVFG